MLTYCSNGFVRTEFMDSVVVGLLQNAWPVVRYAGLRSGPQASMARNTQARRFLGTDLEWLWIVDSDIILAEDTLPKLLEAADPQERPVVGGLYVVQPDPNRPRGQACIYMGGRDKDDRFSFVFADDYPDDEVIQVAATGAGCLLIHRSVFGRLNAKDPDYDGLWFANLTFDGREFGEDMSFSLRLSVAGIPLFVDTGAKVGHVKSVTLFPGKGTMRPQGGYEGEDPG